MASDGVWEFIDSKECMRKIIPYWEQNDPKSACDLIVKKSVENWKREDEAIDDITVIIVFLEIKGRKSNFASKTHKFK